MDKKLRLRLAFHLQRVLSYGTIGAGVNVILYLLYLFFLYSAISPSVSATACYAVGVALSYFLNKKYTFKSSQPHTNDLFKYLIAYGVGLVATIFFINLLILWLPPEVAQILNILFTAVVIYLSLNVLQFGHSPAQEEDRDL